MSQHLGYDLDLFEALPVVYLQIEAYHPRKDDHIPQVCLDGCISFIDPVQYFLMFIAKPAVNGPALSRRQEFSKLLQAQPFQFLESLSPVGKLTLSLRQFGG